jgi:hypothetical protein
MPRHVDKGSSLGEKKYSLCERNRHERQAVPEQLAFRYVGEEVVDSFPKDHRRRELEHIRHENAYRTKDKDFAVWREVLDQSLERGHKTKNKIGMAGSTSRYTVRRLSQKLISRRLPLRWIIANRLFFH